MNKRVTHKIRIVVLVLSMILCVVSLTGCEGFNSAIQDMNGSITGNEYYASFYTNDGQNFMNMHGEKIDLSANTVYEYNYSSGSNERTLSSVVTIAIDGQEVENCGSTVIFAEKGLDPDVNFQVQDIESSANLSPVRLVPCSAHQRRPEQIGPGLFLIILIQKLTRFPKSEPYC
jgi:hypothetical protein